MERFPMLRQQPAQILPENLLKGEAVHFYCLFDGSPFSNIYIFNRWQWNVKNLFDCLIIWK